MERFFVSVWGNICLLKGVWLPGQILILPFHAKASWFLCSYHSVPSVAIHQADYIENWHFAHKNEIILSGHTVL